MKFARYLEETQIPEWKRAYIDFKGLKKRIAAIRNTKQASKAALLPQLPSIPETNGTVQNYGSTNNISTQSISIPHNTTLRVPPLAGHLDTGKGRQGSVYGPRRSFSEGTVQKPLRGVGEGPIEPGYTSRLLGRRRSSKVVSSSHATLESLYTSLEPAESEFFAYLDGELQKVDQFYTARETAAIVRLSELKDQLRELADHRKLFHEVQAHQNDHWKFPKIFGDTLGVTAKPPRLGPPTDTNHIKNNGSSSSDVPTHERPVRDPSEYHHAKRRLKKALREFYRSLELLNDYRILNLTGFRKALKKYEKFTKHSAQDLYMREKIHPCRFSFSGTMDDTMLDVENIYATKFENGDEKKARKTLKSPFQTKSHYFSMFRSGIYLGLAIPPLVSGIYNSFQPHIREKISEWGPLLEIYATLMIFVVFSIFLGVNILTWTQTRINFAFIFELDVRTAIDVREYFELPTILFATLCYALWLSFSLVGNSKIAPTTWPIIWVIFAITLIINPLPILSRDSRYWLIRRTSRLLIAGTSPVGFTDFWLGDQFCSLAFSLAHLYTIGCAYSHHWNNVFTHCGSSTHWGTLVLLTTPYVFRLIQSLRRYYDSRLPTHLINGGKYFSSIVTYITYYIWKSRGSQHDKIFTAWLAFATISSVYSSLWDLLMDWSFLQRYSSHRFLRSQLIYSNNPFIYYFAIVTNIIIRFIWVIYIPIGGLNPRVRSAAVAALEMLRRFQWNFYRLENEQIGNTDQYRATREVPLPYSSMRRSDDDDDDSDIEDQVQHYANGGVIPGVYGGDRSSLRMSKMLARDGHDDDWPSARHG